MCGMCVCVLDSLVWVYVCGVCMVGVCGIMEWCVCVCSIVRWLCVCLCVYVGNDNPLQYSCLENPMDRGV